MIARGALELEAAIESDTAPLHELTAALLELEGALRFMRDPTRGGLATTLNELARASGLAVVLDETALPVRPEVAAACEILGIDPLYVANEGKLVAVVAADAADAALASAARPSPGPRRRHRRRGGGGSGGPRPPPHGARRQAGRRHDGRRPAAAHLLTALPFSAPSLACRKPDSRRAAAVTRRRVPQVTDRYAAFPEPRARPARARDPAPDASEGGAAQRRRRRHAPRARGALAGRERGRRDPGRARPRRRRGLQRGRRPRPRRSTSRTTSRRASGSSRRRATSSTT